VGKRRLETALAAFNGEATVTWHSFELDPEAPADRGMPIAELLARKYGRTPEQAAEMLANMRELAARDGLDIRADIQRPGSTFDGHRLIHLAAESGLGDAMKERLLRAYHSEGELVSDPDVLRRLAAEVGVPEAAVEDLIASDAFTDAVRTDEATAAHIGVQGVPFFVVDRRYAAVGAQDADALVAMFEQAAAATS
jgi:predicted DsbA family dithiol-disulfide isomerase